MRFMSSYQCARKFPRKRMQSWTQFECLPIRNLISNTRGLILIALATNCYAQEVQ